MAIGEMQSRKALGENRMYVAAVKAPDALKPELLRNIFNR